MAYGAKGITNNESKGFFRLYDESTLSTDGEQHYFIDIYKDAGVEAYGALQSYGGAAELNFHGNTTYEGQSYDLREGVLRYKDIDRYGIAIGSQLQNPDFIEKIDEMYIEGKDGELKLDGKKMAYGTCVDITIDLNGEIYYISAVIVDVKEHSAPSSEIQSGIPFFREDEAVDTGQSGPIIEWYTHQIDKNGGDINENLNRFNRKASIIIYRDEVMKYMKSGKTYMVLFTIFIVAILSIAVLFYFKDVNELQAIEKGDYSHLESEITQEVLEKRDSKDFTWIYRDINGDGEEDLIVQDDSASNSILFILSMENDEVVTVFSDLVDMGCYTQLCDNGLLYYDQYYGIYGYELYILYRYDKEWNEKFVEGLELYYIDKPEEGVKLKGNGKLNMEETGLYFWSFKIYDGERVYTKLTQEEWIEKFQDLFGKECEGCIFEYHL